jgi:hypothetical protein
VPAASRPDAALIESGRHCLKRLRASASDCVDDRQHRGGEFIGRRDCNLPTEGAGRMDVAWIAQVGTSSLPGSQRRLGALRDQLRSFSASAAYRCRMKGSASRPSSATMNGTR